MLSMSEDDDEDDVKKVPATPDHQSADGLNRNSVKPVITRPMLAYRDGRLINIDLFTDETKTSGQSQSESEVKSRDQPLEGDSDDSEAREDEEKDEEESEEESGDEEDDHSDLESSGLESDEEKEVEDDDDATMLPTPVEKQISEDIQQTAEEELPYTFKAPKTHAEFAAIIAGQSNSNRLLIIERIRTCHHPSLAEGNKERLATLLTILVRYFGDVAAEKTVDIELIDGLTNHIYELAQQSLLHSGKDMYDLILERHQVFKDEGERLGRSVFPPLSTLLYFKLVGVLFPTSDLKHRVVTPTMLFMGQILTQCQVRNCRDVASSLFLCNLFLMYMRLSKRFVPEAIQYLRGLLFLASDKAAGRVYDVVPPFKPGGRHVNILQLQLRDEEATRNIAIVPQRLMEGLSSHTDHRELETDEFRCWALASTLRLLTQFAELYSELVAARQIFAPVRRCLEAGHIPVQRYPAQIKELHQSLADTLRSWEDRPIKCLKHEEKRPTPMPLFEPLIEENYDPIRKKTGEPSAKKEKKRLVRNVKREMKGAIREVRKDGQFLAREKIKEQAERDVERKEKVKRIYQQLAVQEGDFKAIARARIRFT